MCNFFGVRAPGCGAGAAGSSRTPDGRPELGQGVLTTPRLRLRPVTLDDVPALFEAMRDPRVMAYWSTAPHASPAETAAFVAKMCHGYADGTGRDDYAVDHDGVVIGKAGYWRASELGFLFAASAWGQGFAHEALHALLDHGFGARGFTEVHADVDPENLRCLRLLTRLGFRVMRRVPRTVCVGGVWHDSLDLTLTPEWRP